MNFQYRPQTFGFVLWNGAHGIFVSEKKNFISEDCGTCGSNYKTNKTNVPVSGLKNCEDKKIAKLRPHCIVSMFQGGTQSSRFPF